MAHHIYHTRGIILGSVAIGEANRFYKIFTEELGLVGAYAQSVREGRAKLRYALHDLSVVSLDLVRGKEVWRITSAGGGLGAPRTSAAHTLFARLCVLVSRMVHGEGREDALFRDLLAAREFLETETLSDAETLSLETLAALRVVSALGYLDPEPYERFLEYGVWSLVLLGEFESVRASVVPAVNKALVASHL